jgi:C1A family cysteine protease/putative hemolysin
MRKTILLLMVVLIFCLKLVNAEDYFGFDKVNPFNFNGISGFAIASHSSSEDYHRIGMANPAAIYCTDLGYKYNITDTQNGQEGVCSFPDGSQCEEWQFLEGLCGQNYSYCALNGYDIITINNISVNAYCVNKTTGEVDSVINLFNLVEKSIMSEENLTAEALNASTEGTSIESASATSFVPLPSYFSWRDNGGYWMTTPKDQGVCGSCWAFSAVGVVESRYNIFTNTHTNLDLSEEYLVSDCLTNNDCCGGLASNAHDFFRDQGVPDNNCMTYNDMNCGCDPPHMCPSENTACEFSTSYSCSNSMCGFRCSDWQSRLIKADYSGKITSQNRQQIKEEIFNNGPVSAAMGFGDIVPINGVTSPDGIYRCNDNDVLLIHAIILTGWNDTGGYWIVKNSWGDRWNGDGYFKIAYGDCGIEKRISYSLGFNMVSSGNDVAEFYSQPSPSGTYLISCISQSADFEDDNLYGEDSIEEITFDGNKCKIVGDDTAGDFQQKRYVGVMSIPQGYIPSPPVTQWSPWEYRNQSGYCDGPDCAVETFYSPSCSPGYFPASCLSETGYDKNQGLYGEDDIVGVNITNGRCQVTVYDSVTPDSEYYRRTGVVCLPNVNPITVWGDWSLRNDTSGYHDGGNADIETFYGPSCPSGTLPISCLSESANGENEPKYGEDGILNIEIRGGRCVISANDEHGGFEQKRRVATVCVGTTPPTYSNVVEPPDPSVYNHDATYTFSIDWSGNSPVSQVIIQMDGTSYTPSKSGNTYSMTFSTCNIDTSGGGGGRMPLLMSVGPILPLLFLISLFLSFVVRIKKKCNILSVIFIALVINLFFMSVSMADTQPCLGIGTHNYKWYASNVFGDQNSTGFYSFTIETDPVSVHIISPQNTTYSTNSMDLKYSVISPFEISWIGYSLDNKPNVTLQGNTSLSMTEGSHNIIYYANTTWGVMNSSQKIYFTVSLPKPDLTIGDILTSGNTISYKINNQGNADASSSYSNLWVDGTYITNDYLTSLAKGSSASRTFSYSWTCSGSSDSIKVCADANNNIVESNENNNCLTKTFTCPAPPTCTCTGWINTGDLCPDAINGCYYKYVRTCSPNGCGQQSQCVYGGKFCAV